MVCGREQRPEKYDGKTVCFKARVLVTPQLPDGWIVPGRHGMVCCAEDIQFLGFACNTHGKFPGIQNKGWYTITAHIRIEELAQYKGPGRCSTCWRWNRRSRLSKKLFTLIKGKQPLQVFLQGWSVSKRFFAPQRA